MTSECLCGTEGHALRLNCLRMWAAVGGPGQGMDSGPCCMQNQATTAMLKPGV